MSRQGQAGISAYESGWADFDLTGLKTIVERRR